MKKSLKYVMPYNMQFFAESNEPDNDNQSGQGNGQNDNQQGGQGNNSNQQTPKTFTQDEVTAMMAKEKKQGRSALLKSLGYKTEEELQEAVKLAKTLIDVQKPDEEKLNEEKEKALQGKSEAEERAKVAESKLICFENGVNKDSIDDVLAIAMLKVSDTKDLSKVLQEMKKDTRYGSFFENANGGTGHEPGHNGTSSPKAGELGKRLAEREKQANPEKKSSFFD